MSKWNVNATRTYYSSISFEVYADSYEEAQEKARAMIDDCQVEFDSIDNAEDDDYLEITEGW